MFFFAFLKVHLQKYTGLFSAEISTYQIAVLSKAVVVTLFI